MKLRKSVGLSRSADESGLTLIELMVSLTVFMIIMVSMFSLFVGLVHSAIIAKRRAVGSSLATNQMEYLKSLPYDSLAVAGGAIYSGSPLPATATQTLNNVTYTIKTSINYVDDAYDGCASYPTQALKQLYCRNYPAPSGAPAVDTNPQDYKVIHVSVTDESHFILADVDTQISARVSETASTTGALFVSVIDNTGNPVSGATISVTNSTVTPAVNVSDTTDSHGNAIFYGLPPDSGNDYLISASETGYSSLATIGVSGSLTPTYPNQKILTQQSSYVTLTLKQQGTPSLAIETTDTTGAPLANAKLYVKGGYKKYTLTTDTSYYYDNLVPSDTRPTTDGSGLASISNLVPGTYTFCGDSGSTSCTVGGTTYYLAAAVPYGGSNPFNPIIVPTYDPSNPPTTTYTYAGNNYLQKVRLILTNKSTFPRINTITPYAASKATSNMNAFAFAINGTNLPCSSTAASCATSVSFTQGASTFPASCTGNSNPATQLTCTVNLASSVIGNTQLVISSGGNSMTLPAAPLLGGILVTP
jgi:type II secretory pathway pseudopilin PulG